MTVPGHPNRRSKSDRLADMHYVDVGVCLDWWSGSEWSQQDPCGSNDNNKPPIGMYAEHFCTEGKTHQWRTRGNGHVTVNGKYVALPQAAVEATVRCR